MKRIHPILAKIAAEHLGVPTLKTRRSDSLDFHNVAVWEVKTALAAAFKAGRETASIAPQVAPDLPTPFDDYEIQPCRRYVDADQPDLGFVEPCAPFEADFWTVYGHIPGAGVDAIGDFHTREHAEEVFARITGRRYGDDVVATCRKPRKPQPRKEA
jgi:hypothetical protein